MIPIVDFNDTTTMTRPRKDIVNIMILQELQEVLEALSYWELKGDKDRDSGLPELKSKILALITLIRTPLERQLEKDKLWTITELRDIIYNINYQDKKELYEILDYIESFLYSKDVTKWDTKEAQDRTKVWQMNQKFLG